jgi:hypothetical protein
VEDANYPGCRTTYSVDCRSSLPLPPSHPLSPLRWRLPHHAATLAHAAEKGDAICGDVPEEGKYIMSSRWDHPCALRALAAAPAAREMWFRELLLLLLLLLLRYELLLLLLIWAAAAAAAPAAPSSHQEQQRLVLPYG